MRARKTDKQKFNEKDFKTHLHLQEADFAKAGLIQNITKN